MRAMLPAALALCVCSCSAPVADAWAPAPQTRGERAPIEPTEAALDLHRSTLDFDGHNDLAAKMWLRGVLSFDELDISELQTDVHTDIPRLREGGVGAQFWSVYAPVNLEQPVREVLVQIDLVHRMVQRYSETFELAYSADDVERIHASGKVASLIGIEGGHAISSSLAVLRTFGALGVRYMTLTHGDTLDWADSATDEPRSGGLSAFGEEVVRTMNELGMLVDVSHVSLDTMRDVLRSSAAPIIASHSSAHALAAHPRNVPDDLLRSIAENGGVVMVNFASIYAVPESARKMLELFDVRREMRARYPDDDEFFAALRRWREENPIERGSIHDVVDHIDHIARIAGVDHVGLGSDFDGTLVLPEQLEDPSCYPFITQALLERGYTADDVRRILGGNTLRVLRRAQEVALELRR